MAEGSQSLKKKRGRNMEKKLIIKDIKEIRVEASNYNEPLKEPSIEKDGSLKGIRYVEVSQDSNYFYLNSKSLYLVTFDIILAPNTTFKVDLERMLEGFIDLKFLSIENVGDDLQALLIPYKMNIKMHREACIGKVKN